MDARNVGLGAVLTQWYQGDSKEIRRPVAYASRSLKAAERNYFTTDKEGLAVVWAVKHFNSYILGMHFKIVTDHNTLKNFMDQCDLLRQQAHWQEFFAQYDFIIKYFPGE